MRKAQVIVEEIKKDVEFEMKDENFILNCETLCYFYNGN